MRRILIGVAIALGTAAVAAPALAQAPAGAGCLGLPVDACIASLRASAKLDEGALAASLAQRHRTDVNGRRFGNVVSVIARLPGQVPPVTIVLHLSPDDRVAAAAGTLLRDPRHARTEQEYAETALYDVTARLAGRRCPDAAPLALYRFFENQVKPRLAVRRDDIRGAYSGGHREFAAAERVPYCGIHLSYVGLRQWSGPDDLAFASRASETFTIRFDP